MLKLVQVLGTLTSLIVLEVWSASVQSSESELENDLDRPNGGISEYYTAFLNISYFDKNRGVFHTEKTETGRYSTSTPNDFWGTVVPLISNLTVSSKKNLSVHYETNGKTMKT